MLTIALVLITASMPITAPTPELLPATIPKKMIYAEACIEAQLIKEGEVTK